MSVPQIPTGAPEPKQEDPVQCMSHTKRWKSPRKINVDPSTTEAETTTLSQNVGNKLLSAAVSHSKGVTCFSSWLPNINSLIFQILHNCFFANYFKVVPVKVDDFTFINTGPYFLVANVMDIFPFYRKRLIFFVNTSLNKLHACLLTFSNGGNT